MKTRSSLLPSFILYALIILVCFLLRSNSLEWGFDFDVIMIGATIVFSYYTDFILDVTAFLKLFQPPVICKSYVRKLYT
jgi:hypothetical protein